MREFSSRVFVRSAKSEVIPTLNACEPVIYETANRWLWTLDENA